MTIGYLHTCFHLAWFCKLHKSKQTVYLSDYFYRYQQPNTHHWVYGVENAIVFGLGLIADHDRRVWPLNFGSGLQLVLMLMSADTHNA